MGLSLLGKRILVLKDEPATHSPSGLIELPESSREEKNTGTIVLVGDEVPKEYEGQKCMFQKHCGQIIDYNGVKHICLYTPDLIALIN